MEELTESARQCLVSQGIVLGILSVLTSLGLFLTGLLVICRANDILHFTSLTHLAVLEIVCGISSFLIVAYLWWTIAAYRNRQLEIRSKYLDENMSKGLVVLLLPLLLTFSAFVVSAVFVMLKLENGSTDELKSAMSCYATDISKKVIIDKIQFVLECCGSQSLLDWFLVDWQNNEYETIEISQNDSLADWDSVPFSCCCPEAPPPCVHHQLRVFGVGSLYTSGCADKLDEAVFVFVIMALVLFFCSGFLMILMGYSSRKLQTSARSAVRKGDATAPGLWWLLTPNCPEIPKEKEEDRIPLLEPKEKPEPKPQNIDQSDSDVWYSKNRVILSPVIMTEKSKALDSTAKEDWETYKSSKHRDAESSEEWTRMAYNASGSTSTTSFLTTSAPMNSTPDSRHSVSDTAVANLEVSHHFEHKVRPLFRS